MNFLKHLRNNWKYTLTAIVILAAVLPIFYSEIASNGLSKTTATSYWGYTNTIAMTIIALSSPLLGSIGDYTSKRKRFLFVFAVTGMIATGLLFLVQKGQWIMASVLFIFGRIGFAGDNIFYDSLLPYVANEKIIDQGYRQNCKQTVGDRALKRDVENKEKDRPDGDLQHHTGQKAIT